MGMKWTSIIMKVRYCIKMLRRSAGAKKKRIKYLCEQLEKLELIEEPTEQDKIAFDVVCKELREKHKLEHISHKLYCELD